MGNLTDIKTLGLTALLLRMKSSNRSSAHVNFKVLTKYPISHATILFYFLILFLRFCQTYCVDFLQPKILYSVDVSKFSLQDSFLFLKNQVSFLISLIISHYCWWLISLYPLNLQHFTFFLGLNLMSQFNLENVTKYTKKTDEDVSESIL